MANESYNSGETPAAPEEHAVPAMPTPSISVWAHIKDHKIAALACVYWAMGRRAESDSAVGNLERGFRDRSEYLIASAHACRAEADAAFEWVERTYQQRRGTLFVLKVDPLLRNLRADPRFDALVRKAKLTV